MVLTKHKQPVKSFTDTWLQQSTNQRLLYIYQLALVQLAIISSEVRSSSMLESKSIKSIQKINCCLANNFSSTLRNQLLETQPKVNYSSYNLKTNWFRFKSVTSKSKNPETLEITQPLAIQSTAKDDRTHAQFNRSLAIQSTSKNDRTNHINTLLAT